MRSTDLHRSQDPEGDIEDKHKILRLQGKTGKSEGQLWRLLYLGDMVNEHMVLSITTVDMRNLTCLSSPMSGSCAASSRGAASTGNHTSMEQNSPLFLPPPFKKGLFNRPGVAGAILQESL